MGRLKDLPPDQRPRERLLAAGPERLQDGEVLALLIGSGRPGRDALALAEDLLGSLDSLAALGALDPVELTRRGGLGPAQAARLAAAVELGRRILRAECGPRPRIRTAADVHRLFRGRVAGRRRETFWVVGLSARHQVEQVHRVAQGSVTSVQVHPQEVFRPLVRRGAAAALLVHNHPSGDPTPSPDDIRMTHRLVDAGALLGIPVLDHVVVTPARYASLAEEGHV